MLSERKEPTFQVSGAPSVRTVISLLSSGCFSYLASRTRGEVEASEGKPSSKHDYSLDVLGPILILACRSDTTEKAGVPPDVSTASFSVPPANRRACDPGEEVVDREQEIETVEESSKGDITSIKTIAAGPKPSVETENRKRSRRDHYFKYSKYEAPHYNQCLWQGCSRQFGSLHSLVLHIKESHVEMESCEKFACMWKGCARGQEPFRARHMLLVHMRRHTGERPHRCEVG